MTSSGRKVSIKQVFNQALFNLDAKVCNLDEKRLELIQSHKAMVPVQNYLCANDEDQPTSWHNQATNTNTEGLL